MEKIAINVKKLTKNSQKFDEKIEIRERWLPRRIPRERWFSWFLGFDSKTVQRSAVFPSSSFLPFLFIGGFDSSALCRSRRELSNKYLLAKFGFDTAENELCKVCPLSAYRSPRYGFPNQQERLLDRRGASGGGDGRASERSKKRSGRRDELSLVFTTIPVYRLPKPWPLSAVSKPISSTKGSAFSGSTRLARFCTAPSSKLQFFAFFRKFCDLSSKLPNLEDVNTFRQKYQKC